MLHSEHKLSHIFRYLWEMDEVRITVKNMFCLTISAVAQKRPQESYKRAIFVNWPSATCGMLLELRHQAPKSPKRLYLCISRPGYDFMLVFCLECPYRAMRRCRVSLRATCDHLNGPKGLLCIPTERVRGTDQRWYLSSIVSQEWASPLQFQLRVQTSHH